METNYKDIEFNGEESEMSTMTDMIEQERINKSKKSAGKREKKQKKVQKKKGKAKKRFGLRFTSITLVMVMGVSGGISYKLDKNYKKTEEIGALSNYSYSGSIISSKSEKNAEDINTKSIFQVPSYVEGLGDGEFYSNIKKALEKTGKLNLYLETQSTSKEEIEAEAACIRAIISKTDSIAETCIVLVKVTDVDTTEVAKIYNVYKERFKEKGMACIPVVTEEQYYSNLEKLGNNVALQTDGPIYAVDGDKTPAFVMRSGNVISSILTNGQQESFAMPELINFQQERCRVLAKNK